MSKETLSHHFTGGFNAVNEICKQRYCLEKEGLTNPIVKVTKAMLKQCHKECAQKYKGESMKYSECQSRCSQDKNYNKLVKNCEKVCEAKKDVINEVTDKHFEDIRNKMANEMPDSKFKEYKEGLISAKNDEKLEKLKSEQDKYDNIVKQIQDKHTDLKKAINILTKKEYVKNKEIISEEVKTELLSKVKKIIEDESYESLVRLINKGHVLNITCKDEYCSEQAEKNSDCLSKCNLKKEVLDWSSIRYEGCKDDCKGGIESKKQECKEKCNTKQKVIENVTNEYYKEVESEIVQDRKISTDKIAKELFNKVKEIMEESDSIVEENLASDAYYGTELLLVA